MARRPRPTLVLLVRHGRTPTTGDRLPGRAPGLHLSPEGREQAEAVARRIAALGRVRAVYASPMERARETAEPIAAATRRTVEVVEGLNECDFGAWTGRSLATLRRRRDWALVQSHPSRFRFPGGESFAGMQQRMVETIDGLRRRHRGGTIVCTSHADPIKAVAAWALGVHLDLFQRIVINPCSVTALMWGDGPPVVLTVNSTGGLGELAPA